MIILDDSYNLYKSKDGCEGYFKLGSAPPGWLCKDPIVISSLEFYKKINFQNDLHKEIIDRINQIKFNYPNRVIQFESLVLDKDKSLEVVKSIVQEDEKTGTWSNLENLSAASIEWDIFPDGTTLDTYLKELNLPPIMELLK